MDTLPELITPAQLAEYLGISLNSLYMNRHRGGDLPPAIKVGKHLRYRRPDVQAWLDAKEVAA